MSRFSRWLYESIFWKEITQQELANAIGISQSAISLHLSGRRKPTYRSVKKYCEFFGEPDAFGVYELTLMG